MTAQVLDAAKQSRFSDRRSTARQCHLPPALPVPVARGGWQRVPRNLKSRGRLCQWDDDEPEAQEELLLVEVAAPGGLGQVAALSEDIAEGDFDVPL